MMQKRPVQRCVALCVVVVGAMLVAGCGDESEPSGPEARVVFMHNLAGLAEVTVLFDGEAFTKLSPGELTSANVTSPGTVKMEIDSSGVVLPTLEQQLELEEQTYLVALTGVITQNESVWVVDQIPPEVEEGSHQFEVVNLRTDGAEFKVFAGSTEIASAPEGKTVTPFVPVPAGSIALSLTEGGGGAPIKIEDSAEFSDGGASMVLIGGEGDDFTINVLKVK